MLAKLKLCTTMGFCVFLFGCETRSTEESYFLKPLDERQEIARKMSTRDVYELYRYEANTTPPTSDTALVLGERGEASFRILIEDLQSRDNLIRSHDYLPILEAQCNFSKFCVCNDSSQLLSLKRAILQTGSPSAELPRQLQRLCR